ncbi:hypothetical protein OPT61_g2384 [Boeremia exigua]|uniref:Uncharacterized protein n=1 Tax=Boeremia exigua TaxID=749465 RepID=A0ACC2ILR7_9PLEO|nr:hypothetical protein OPT61_g2384 [Boeremia exigua]
MPPKKNAAAPEVGIAGYDNKETKLLAAAFVSSIGTDKYDYALFAQLSGFTEGTLKKFWPPVKKKVMEEHPNFGKFLTGAPAAAASTAKATASKKRKAADTDADAELEPEASPVDDADKKTSEGKAKKAPAKRGKKVKTEEEVVKEEENSAGAEEGEFIYNPNVVAWLANADGMAEVV